MTLSDDEALIIDEYDSEEKIYAGRNNQPQREAAALAAFRDSNKSTSGFQLFFAVVTLLSMIGIRKYRNKHS